MSSLTAANKPGYIWASADCIIEILMCQTTVNQLTATITEPKYPPIPYVQITTSASPSYRLKSQISR